VGDVRIETDVEFGTGGGRALRCDVYRPAAHGGPAPGVLLLHGGGWRQGSRAMMDGYGARLAAEGFLCVASEYRLTPEAPWPAQIEDVKTAIRWMRAHAGELVLDESRIAALGRSAGAHLALLAAGTPGLTAFEGSGGNAGVSASLAAVAAIFPPTVFSPGEERVHGGSPARALLGEAATAEAAQAASPLTSVRPGYPPTFLLHGTADKVVPPSASLVMYEALVAAGVPAELHLYAEQPHGFAAQPEFIDLCCAEIAHFLRRYLVAAEQREEAQAAAV
jgi:acetyl esterase/lipase